MASGATTKKALTNASKHLHRRAYDNVHYVPLRVGGTSHLQMARRLSDQDIMRRYRMIVRISPSDRLVRFEQQTIIGYM